MTSILTVAQYRDFDDLPSPAENDDQISKAITTAINIINNRTGRTFYAGASPLDATEVLNGKGTKRIFTVNSPIQSLDSLEYWDGTQWVEYDSTTYPYTFKSDSNLIYFTQGHKFYKGFRNIRVTFTYGYDDSGFPEELQYACYLIAKYIVVEAERLGIDRQTDGEQSFWYNHSFPTKAKEIIARYKTEI